jgi:hypothetical protein
MRTIEPTCAHLVPLTHNHHWDVDMNGKKKPAEARPSREMQTRLVIRTTDAMAGMPKNTLL